MINNIITMEYIAGVTVLKTIGLDLTLKCISTLTVSTQSVYNLLSNIKSSVHTKDLTNVLKEMDLENDILILESIFKEIDLENHHTKTLALCLESLKVCVSEIENKLSEVNNRIIYNQSLWIASSMRSYVFDDIINSLKLLKLNLDNRKKTLFEVIKINAYLNPYLNIEKNCDITIIEPL